MNTYLNVLKIILNSILIAWLLFASFDPEGVGQYLSLVTVGYMESMLGGL